jgi:cob(I)alamin adenosyltransferase
MTEPTNQKSAAEIATDIKKVETQIAEEKNTPATDIKDAKWIETRISELENELNDLRETRKSAGKPSAASASKVSTPDKPSASTSKRGMMETFMGWGDEDKD